MNNILVTGATGHLGKAVVNYLLKKTGATNIKVLVRDAAKVADLAAQGVEVRTGDYGDREALLKAFAGIDRLYLVSGTDLAKRGEQQKIVVQTAKDAGVKHIVYTSFQRKNESEDSPISFVAASHLSTENAIKKSGLIYTLLLDSLYTDVIPVFAGEQAVEQHAVNFPSSEGKTAFALRDDMAEASANILLDNSGQYDNRSILFTGAEALTWKQVAEYIGQITGKDMIHNSPAVDDYKSALTAAHVPAEFVMMLGGFAQATAQGYFEEVSPQMEQILGRKPITVKHYLEQVYGRR